ncbi:MAG: TonB-dependent receptor [Bryobacteraceae bacterium]
MKSLLASRFSTFLAALAILCASTLSAQTFVGGLRGSVQDPGGAVIGDARVTLTNEGTGVSRTTNTNALGEYVFSQLEPATYSISVESAGFKKLTRTGVIVGTQENVNVDLKMEIGQVSESVQVTGEVALIENTNASNGQVLNTQQVDDLPNLGRNTFLLSKLNNGVVPSGPPSWNRFQDQTGSSNLSIGGGPIRGNNYLIDGVPVTDSNNRAVIIPSEEGVQEMKLQTGTYDATMGRTGGGVFNTVIKSGTNDLHGDILGYYRPADATANNFFNNAAGLPATPEKWENWAGSLSGPIVLPKIYNGRNKTFFFVASEGYLDAQPQAQAFVVPTAAEIAGNFSAAGKTIYNPLSNVACTATSGCPSGATVIRVPFAGNIIPASQISPVGQAILSQFPTSNTNQTGVIDSSNFQGKDSLGNHAEQFIYKMEQDIGQSLRLTGTFMYYKSHEPGGNSFDSPIGAGSTSYLLDRHVDATVLNAIYTLNPTTVATVRYGFNRFPNVTDYVDRGFNQTKLGLPASYVNSLQVAEFPAINLSEGGETVGGSGPSNDTFASDNLSFAVSKFAGKHNLTMGIDYRKLKVGGISWSGGEGTFTFNGIFSQQYNTTTASTTGADIADLLLGFPSSGSVGTASDEYYSVNYYSGYLQDDIRATNKLTFNVGLRYEFETGEAEKYNNFIVGFNQTAFNPIQASLPAGSGVAAYGAPLIQGQNGNPNACCNARDNKFGPRAGFAYQLNDKTTIRGGWGIFYAPMFFSLDTQYSPGLSQTTTYLASADGFATPANSLSNPYPTGVIQPATVQKGVLQQLGGSTYFPDLNRQNALVQQFSADIQRQLPLGIALEVGYVGSRSSHLMASYSGAAYEPINQIPTQYLSMGSALATKVANPFYGLPNVSGSLGAATVSEAQLLLPFPEYSQVYDSASYGKAQYDSLILKAQKRLSKGLVFLTTYTWSKSIDNTYGGAGANYFNNCNGPCTAAPAYPQNVYNLAAEWALAAGSQPSRFTVGWTYELPFGTGKPMLANNRALNYVVGGWSINGTGIIATGFPLGVFQTNANTSIGTLEQRPNATGVSPVNSGSPESLINSCNAKTNPVCYINAAAFSLAPAYTFGNTSRELPFYGPGIANWDISLFKTVTIREHYRAQFRAEALNAFNTPNFANPQQQFQGVTTATGKPVGPFGQINTQFNIPRELQLGLRFSF